VAWGTGVTEGGLEDKTQEAREAREGVCCELGHRSDRGGGGGEGRGGNLCMMTSKSSPPRQASMMRYKYPEWSHTYIPHLPNTSASHAYRTGKEPANRRGYGIPGIRQR
jgi:hypothetical protein